MKKLSYYLNVFCSSYTIASIIVGGILNCDEMFPNTWLVQMAVLCAVITVLMFVTDAVSETIFKEIPVWVFVFVGLIEVSACVLLLGGLCFKWFTFDLKWIPIVLLVDTVIYFAVFGIMLIREKSTADNINKILRNNRKQNFSNNRRNKNGKDY